MMLGELAKSYAPAEAEAEVRAKWEASDAFHARPGGDAKPYCIVIPPPNVTAPLHLGHALNNTLQDVLIRYHRMRGCNTLWMPGTDHAGIATQTVVEKRLLQQGKKRVDLGRERFVATVQQWKDQYEATIIEQLKAMGCSCDWDRTRFTMDEMCANAVREAFFRLFKDGLIYRGKRLVNWDPVTLTALADDEVEMREVQGHMWYLRYPLTPPASAGGVRVEYITVATTRPETMLGDTAVAMNPKDPRAVHLVGKQVRLPIVNRIIPIIADEHVVMPSDPDNPMAEYATGFLKVTPAHDPNDWDIGQRHDLPVINVLAPDATISTDHGWDDCSDEAQPLVGLAREEARKAIVQWFKDHDLLQDVRDYKHSVGHSYRSHVPIEPYLSDQWYVKVTDDRMTGEALRALSGAQYEGSIPSREAASGDGAGDGELSFYPARYAKTFQAWHENLRDWCISRQLWWGHRIPVWRGVPESFLYNTGDAFHSAFRAFQTKIDTWEDENRVKMILSPEVEGLSVQDQINYPRHIGVRDPEGEDRQIVEYLEAEGFTQDPDVLDTWFSSALWPISTMGWPEPKDYPETIGLLETFNPSSVLTTGRDIITLWVSRMVMFNRYFRNGTLPFRHVYIHPMIQDGHGQRMSKSLGNGVDPRDIIHTHGADALRYIFVQMATTTQDVRLPVDMLCPHCEHAFRPTQTKSPTGHRVSVPEPQCPNCSRKMVSAYGIASGLASPTDDTPLARNTSQKFDLGRNFANKLWNAARFALGQMNGETSGDVRLSELSLVDRWILARLYRIVRKIEAALAEYQFNVYADAMYEFIWGDFCDWYLEAIKPTVKDSSAQQQVLRTVLNAILRILHPICPFVTESLWPHVQATGDASLEGICLAPSEMLAEAAWPEIDAAVDDMHALADFSSLQALVESIRNIRGAHNVPPKKDIRLFATPTTIALIDRADRTVSALAGLSSVQTIDHRPADALVFTFDGEEQALADVIEKVDPEMERDRLQRQITDLQKRREGLVNRLANPGYTDKAPAHLVDETRTQLATVEADLGAAEKAINTL
ncbi:MAG: valine--tRNA ligase [Planctomycetes bacterium]|nr:valine--tRNA ligase [Planctomycetota bacterium]